MEEKAQENRELLKISDLEVNIHTDNGVVHAVRGLNFSLYQGETLAVVGESGCGKSITFKSIIGLLPSTGRVDCGSILFEGSEIANIPERELRKIRGQQISMIFQDPLTSLNPTMNIGDQIAEMLKLYRKNMDAGQRRNRVYELLDMVGIPNPKERYRQFPHQFSGGMRQRVMIAMALSCDPKILIADEPTTALDVTIQAQILDLLKKLQQQLKTTIVIITHNLGVVASIASRLIVLYGGRIVEQGLLREIFYEMRHPYTRALMDSIPRLNTGRHELSSIPGSPPDLMELLPGCPFAARCSRCMEVCVKYSPPFVTFSETHSAACWLYDPRNRTGD
ncbi:MAG: ABC transporter ATP-binding protein [Treponema sp.]|nr:ABC transporter ATP-binding protein [Treponema sp.]